MQIATFTLLLMLTLGLDCGSKIPDTDVLQNEPNVDVPARTAVVQNENSAQALYAVAPHVYRVEIIDLSTHEVRATLDKKTVERMKSSIISGGLDTSFTATPPPWNVVLHLYVPERTPFIAHPVGTSGLRLRSDDPENPAVPSIDEGFELVAGEVTIDIEVFGALRQILGEPSKEYRMDDFDRQDMIEFLRTNE
jgi:hypothetical protein